MTDENTYNELSEQTRKLSVASSFTNGDVEKARQMIAGKYNDVKAIKGTVAFEEADRYACYLLFMNIVSSAIINMSIIPFSTLEIYKAINIFDSWKLFYKACDKLTISPDVQASSELGQHLCDSIVGYDIFDDVKEGDVGAISYKLEEIFNKFYGIQGANCKIALEDTSSFALTEENIPIADGLDASSDEQQAAEPVEKPAIEQEYEFVVEGKVIVSPVRGKYVNMINKGERIKLLFVNRDPVSLKIARSHHALSEENEYIPIKARVREKIAIDDGGYIFYCPVAKNVLAKIVEEENVKIEMDTFDGGKVEKYKKEGNLSLYIGLLFGLILLTVIILYVLL